MVISKFDVDCLIAIHDTIIDKDLIHKDSSLQKNSMAGGSQCDSIDCDSIKGQDVDSNEKNTFDPSDGIIKSVQETRRESNQAWKIILKFCNCINYPRYWISFMIFYLIGIKRRYLLNIVYQTLKMIT